MQTRINRILAVLSLLSCMGFALPLFAENTDAGAIVQNAFNYMRGEASVSRVKMVIHRPDWERTMVLQVHTKGEEYSVFRIIEPAKDKGNGTLKKENDMWMYNPRVNRVIKLPPSMMSQSWQGSDFSNNDIAKSNTMIEDYTHEITGEETHEGKKVYVIRSLPKPKAPVVWGMLKLKIREDRIFLYEGFYDEDKNLVKEMFMKDIREMGGRLTAAVWLMKKADEKDKYTQVEYLELEYKESLPDSLFTLSSLRNPGR